MTAPMTSREALLAKLSAFSKDELIEELIGALIRVTELATPQRAGVAQNSWSTDFLNAPSPCLGWCKFPAGEGVRMIYRESHRGATGWQAHGSPQNVVAWQPLPVGPSVPSTLRAPPGGQTMDEAATGNFGLTVDDLDEDEQ